MNYDNTIRGDSDDGASRFDKSVQKWKSSTRMGDGLSALRINDGEAEVDEYGAGSELGQSSVDAGHL